MVFNKWLNKQEKFKPKNLQQPIFTCDTKLPNKIKSLKMSIMSNKLNNRLTVNIHYLKPIPINSIINTLIGLNYQIIPKA